MPGYLDHVALKVNGLESTVQFFEEVFGMHVERQAGTKPARKVWLKEGIQLNETEELAAGREESQMDHISIKVSNQEEILEKCKAYGCNTLPEGSNWFQMPSGIKIELK